MFLGLSLHFIVWPSSLRSSFLRFPRNIQMSFILCCYIPHLLLSCEMKLGMLTDFVIFLGLPRYLSKIILTPVHPILFHWLCRTDEPAFTMMHLATSFSIYSAPSCLCLETKLRIEDEIISSSPKRPTCRSTFNRKYSSKIWIEFPYLCIYHTRHYGLFTTLVFRFHLLMNLFTRNRIHLGNRTRKYLSRRRRTRRPPRRRTTRKPPRPRTTTPPRRTGILYSASCIAPRCFLQCYSAIFT